MVSDNSVSSGDSLVGHNRNSVSLDDVVHLRGVSNLLRPLVIASLRSSHGTVGLVEVVLHNGRLSVVLDLLSLVSVGEPFLGSVNGDLSLAHNSDPLVDDLDMLNGDSGGVPSDGSRVNLGSNHDLADGAGSLLGRKLRGLSKDPVDSSDDLGLFLDGNVLLLHDLDNLSDGPGLLGVLVDNLLVVCDRSLLVNNNDSSSLVDFSNMPKHALVDILNELADVDLVVLQDSFDGTFDLLNAQFLGLAEHFPEAANNLHLLVSGNMVLLHVLDNLPDGLGFNGVVANDLRVILPVVDDSSFDDNLLMFANVSDLLGVLVGDSSFDDNLLMLSYMSDLVGTISQRNLLTRPSSGKNIGSGLGVGGLEATATLPQVVALHVFGTHVL